MKDPLTQSEHKGIASFPRGICSESGLHFLGRTDRLTWPRAFQNHIHKIRTCLTCHAAHCITEAWLLRGYQSMEQCFEEQAKCILGKNSPCQGWQLSLGEEVCTERGKEFGEPIVPTLISICMCTFS